MNQPLTLPPWSFSMLEAFEQCNRKAFHKYLLKEKEPQTEAQRKGNEADKALELRIKDGTPLTNHLARLEPLMLSLAGMKEQDCQLYTQLKMGITRDFKPSDFFGDSVWGRGVLDFCAVKRRTENAMATATIIDFKNGKNNEGKPWYDGGLQRKIFTLFLWKQFPGVDKVTAFNLYLEEQKAGKVLIFDRTMERQLWLEVLPRIMRMEAACSSGRWPETPGPLCGYCPVKSCSHNRS